MALKQLAGEFPFLKGMLTRQGRNSHKSNSSTSDTSHVHNALGATVVSTGVLLVQLHAVPVMRVLPCTERARGLQTLVPAHLLQVTRHRARMSAQPHWKPFSFYPTVFLPPEGGDPED